MIPHGQFKRSTSASRNVAKRSLLISALSEQMLMTHSFTPNLFALLFAHQHANEDLSFVDVDWVPGKYLNYRIMKALSDRNYDGSVSMQGRT